MAGFGSDFASFVLAGISGVAGGGVLGPVAGLPDLKKSANVAGGGALFWPLPASSSRRPVDGRALSPDRALFSFELVLELFVLELGEFEFELLELTELLELLELDEDVPLEKVP